jgi:hypothetical protein
MNEMPNSLLATDESAPVISAGRYGLYEKNGNLLIEKHFVLPPQAVIILHCNNCPNAPRRIDPKGSNPRRMKLSGGSTRSDKSALGKAMASDDKKIKTNPASKNEASSKDKSGSGVDTSKAEAGSIADAAPSGYSRGEGQKPVSKAYKDNWNAIFAKKKKR